MVSHNGAEKVLELRFKGLSRAKDREKVMRWVVVVCLTYDDNMFVSVDCHVTPKHYSAHIPIPHPPHTQSTILVNLMQVRADMPQLKH